MDLNGVKLFVQAAEAGSISEAARRTGIPLPTLSRQLRKLEDDLGIRFLERGPRGLALTPAGNQLVSDAQPALASWHRRNSGFTTRRAWPVGCASPCLPTSRRCGSSSAPSVAGIQR